MEEEYSTVCKNSEFKIRYFLFDKISMNHEQTMKYCQKLGGRIFVTEDQEKTQWHLGVHDLTSNRK